VWFPVPHVGLDPRSFSQSERTIAYTVARSFNFQKPVGRRWLPRLARNPLRPRILRRTPSVDGNSTCRARALRRLVEQTPQPLNRGEATLARVHAALRRPNWPLPCGLDVRRGPRLPFRGRFERNKEERGGSHPCDDRRAPSPRLEAGYFYSVVVLTRPILPWICSLSASP